MFLFVHIIFLNYLMHTVKKILPKLHQKLTLKDQNKILICQIDFFLHNLK